MCNVQNNYCIFSFVFLNTISSMCLLRFVMHDKPPLFLLHASNYRLCFEKTMQNFRCNFLYHKTKIFLIVKFYDYWCLCWETLFHNFFLVQLLLWKQEWQLTSGRDKIFEIANCKINTVFLCNTFFQSYKYRKLILKNNGSIKHLTRYRFVTWNMLDYKK